MNPTFCGGFGYLCGRETGAIAGIHLGRTNRETHRVHQRQQDEGQNPY